jgi:hypothetical protein
MCPPADIRAIKQRPQLSSVAQVGVIRDPGLDLSPEASLNRHFHALFHSPPSRTERSWSILASWKIVDDSPQKFP